MNNIDSLKHEQLKIELPDSDWSLTAFIEGCEKARVQSTAATDYTCISVLI